MDSLKLYEVQITDIKGIEHKLYVSAENRDEARFNAEYLLFIDKASFVDSFNRVTLIKELN